MIKNPFTHITPTIQRGGLTGREVHLPRIPFTCRTITPMRRDVSHVFSHIIRSGAVTAD